jgi:hypothetical protein
MSTKELMRRTEIEEIRFLRAAARYGMTTHTRKCNDDIREELGRTRINTAKIIYQNDGLAFVKTPENRLPTE